MKEIIEYFVSILKAVKSLTGGMMVTGKYFVSPWKIVTQKYPENRRKLKMFDRFKGELVMLHDENNQFYCNGCGICGMNCPNGSIEIITKKKVTAEGKQGRTIDKFIYHLSMCTFCGLCVKVCPSKALAFSQEFEHAVFDKHKLTRVLNAPGFSQKIEIKEIKKAV